MNNQNLSAQFHQDIEALFEHIENVMDQSGWDLDIENTGILTIGFANGSHWIFSRQDALGQLWLATPQGGYHFDLNDSKWVLEGEKIELYAFLNQLAKEHFGQSFNF